VTRGFVCTAIVCTAIVCAVSVCALAGCRAFNPCAAADAPFADADIAQGIAGVVTAGTEACHLGAATMLVYPSNGPLHGDDDARAVLTFVEPVVIDVGSRGYQRALATGDYVVCKGAAVDGRPRPRMCIRAAVAKDRVTTIHARDDSALVAFDANGARRADWFAHSGGENGEPCVLSNECQNGACVDGACATLCSTNAACVSPATCVDRVCTP
jgi:hypothetical protein